MLSKTLNIDKAALITKYDDDMSPLVCEDILSMAERRAGGEPLSYILGEAEFYGRPFAVGKGVLVPRPETELLVEEMLRYVREGDLFADWCVGSGCIGATILLETNDTKCVGVDSSRLALGWARKNIERYGLRSRFTLMQNTEPSEAGFVGNYFDFIVANPPYIPSEEIPGLMRDVRDYEPLDALDGGRDGISLYKKILRVFPLILKPGGYCGFEIAGDRQADIILKIVANSLSLVRKVVDYNGILRHLIWRKNLVA